MINNSGIYKIEYKGECLYIGQSITLDDRRKSHLRKLRNGNHANVYLQRLYNKYGDNFVFSVVEECNPKILTEREMYWISKLNPKCNMQIPCDSNIFTIKQESRDRMSKSSKAKMTNDMRIKISQKTKEAMHRPDVWNNFIQGQNNKKNKNPWNKGTKGLMPKPWNCKRVYCVELKKEFKTAFEAGLYIGAKNGKGVSRVCLGQRSKYKDMHWYYIK